MRRLSLFERKPPSEDLGIANEEHAAGPIGVALRYARNPGARYCL